MIDSRDQTHPLKMDLLQWRIKGTIPLETGDSINLYHKLSYQKMEALIKCIITAFFIDIYTATRNIFIMKWTN